MFVSRIAKRPKWILMIAFLVLVIFIVFLPQVRQTLRTSKAFQSFYLSYSKWRYKWRSPSDLGSGKDRLEVVIDSPMGIAEDSLGNIYVADREQRVVWKIEPSGRAVIIAGTGMATGAKGLSRARLPAQTVDLASPEGLAIDHQGNLLLADSYNHSILKIDSEGYLTQLAGNGMRGYNGDNLPATEASLNFPYDVRVDSKGNIYIADTWNHRIRKVDGSGVITTVAGNGVAGFSGDGGPADKAQLNTPYGLFLDNADNLLITDSDNNVIRRVGQNGLINSIAGTGERGYDGDGGSALRAKFDSPQSLAMDELGRIYINDEHNNAIRVLDVEGTIRTLIGTRGPGFSGDGGPASAAQIADPENIWVRKDGSILISARDNGRVRIISSDGRISTFAGIGPTSTHDYFAPISLPAATP